jgi:hypothetical protein
MTTFNFLLFVEHPAFIIALSILFLCAIVTIYSLYIAIKYRNYWYKNDDDEISRLARKNIMR